MTQGKAFRGRALRWGLPLAGLIFALIMAGIWHWSFLAHYATFQHISAALITLRRQWWISLAIPPIYIVAHMVIFPHMVLDAATILTFGGFRGWAYTILGSLSSASFFFLAGRRLGCHKLEGFQNARLRKLRRTLLRGGIGTVIVIRIVPLAPFAVVNLMAGASGIKFWHFLTGTFVALLPGTLTLALFGEQLKALRYEPSLRTIILAVLILLAGAIALWHMKRLVNRRFPR